MPHAPQFCGSLLLSTQLPEHSSGVAAVHLDTHAPAVQSGVVPEQTVVQVPHREGLIRSVSQNSRSFAVQCPHPSSHDVSGTTHRPCTQLTGAPTLTRGNLVQSAAVTQFQGPPSGLSPSSVGLLASRSSTLRPCQR